mgnify:CR=1 FL=1
MSNDNLNDLFENLENRFDVEAPNLGHQQRFLNKLVKQRQNGEVFVEASISKSKFWKPFIGIAASIAILVSAVSFINQSNSQLDLAEILPEMAQTETVFTIGSTIFLSLGDRLNELRRMHRSSAWSHSTL